MGKSQMVIITANLKSTSQEDMYSVCGCYQEYLCTLYSHLGKKSTQSGLASHELLATHGISCVNREGQRERVCHEHKMEKEHAKIGCCGGRGAQLFCSRGWMSGACALHGSDPAGRPDLAVC